jgi:hypothetical protein
VPVSLSGSLKGDFIASCDGDLFTATNTLRHFFSSQHSSDHAAWLVVKPALLLFCSQQLATACPLPHLQP